MGLIWPVLSHKPNMKSPFLSSLSTHSFLTLFVCLPCPWMLKMPFSPHTLQGFPPPGPSWEGRRGGSRTGALHFLRFFLKGPAFLCPCLEGFYGFSQCFRSSYSGFFPPLFLVVTWKCTSQYISRSTSWKYEHLKLITSLSKTQ